MLFEKTLFFQNKIKYQKLYYSDLDYLETT